MENNKKREIIEFLNLFNYPKKQKSNLLHPFDRKHENDPIIIILDEFERPRSMPKSPNKQKIEFKGKVVSKKMNSDEKITILMFLICSYHNDATNEIDSENEELILFTGQLFGLKKSEVQDMIDFQLNNEPFNDKVNSVYFVNTSDKITCKQIGVNTRTYSNDDITYVKYLKKNNICLAKKFIKKDIGHYTSEKEAFSSIHVLSTGNYSREEFGYYSFEELIEAIEEFDPISFCELEATGNTPKIILDPELGKIIISGKSSPLSPTNFFSPVLDWINAYRTANVKPLEIYLMLDYFNTYTSKFLMLLAQESKLANEKGQASKLFWFCDSEDDDLVEFGEHLKSINHTGVEFCFINDEMVA